MAKQFRFHLLKIRGILFYSIEFRVVKCEFRVRKSEFRCRVVKS